MGRLLRSRARFRVLLLTTQSKRVLLLECASVIACESAVVMLVLLDAIGETRVATSDGDEGVGLEKHSYCCWCGLCRGGSSTSFECGREKNASRCASWTSSVKGLLVGGRGEVVRMLVKGWGWGGGCGSGCGVQLGLVVERTRMNPNQTFGVEWIVVDGRCEGIVVGRERVLRRDSVCLE